MSIYAISDLHLSFAPSVDKPMDIYGDRWYDHARRIGENWCSTVRETDTVVIPGDISWGLKLDEARYDLDWIDRLPGHKVLFKGNHDLWWSGITKLNKMYDRITFIQNDFYLAEDVYICGSRGWLTPDSDDYGPGDEKIYRREKLRLESSLAKAEADMSERYGAGEGEIPDGVSILGVLHYPPVSKVAGFSGFQQIFEDHGVKHVIYGHIHGEEGSRSAIRGVHHGIRYDLVSADHLGCRLMRIQ